MSFIRIADSVTRVIRNLPNRPTGTGYMTAAALKASFDQAAEAIKDAFNLLLDQLEAATAAAKIGFESSVEVPASTVQTAIEEVQRQLAGITQGAVANGSITAEKLASDAFDWTDVSEDLEDYTGSDYTSNDLKIYYCAPLKMMRVEGWVRFTPTSSAGNLGYCYERFVLPTPVSAEGAVPLTAGVIGSVPRMDLAAKAEIRQGSYLDVYLGGAKLSDYGNRFEVFVHGFYLCEEASA